MNRQDFVAVVPWEERYAEDFISLSVEWLEKYVSVEPADIEILYHPHEAVLDHGGMIFFAVIGKKVIGTVAMLPTDSYTMELAKLAVTENYKGRHIGEMLMDAALSFAREKQVSNVILYTNRKLFPAIHLYEKYGFREIPLEKNKYLESDMMMVLNI